MSDKETGDEGQQFCMMCGAPNLDWARYCRACGAELKGAVKPTKAVEAELDRATEIPAKERIAAEEPLSFKSFIRWLFNPSFALPLKVLVYIYQSSMAVWSLLFTGGIFLRLLARDILGVGCFLWFFFPLVFAPTWWFVQSMALLYSVWVEKEWGWWLKFFASLGILVASNLLWGIWGYGLIWLFGR